MRDIVLRLALMLVFIAGCAPSEPPPDPVTILSEATANMRAVDTFRITVEQSGAPYNIVVDLLGNGFFTEVGFRRASAQFVAPNVLQADARIVAPGGIVTDVGLFAQGANQWFRLQPGDWLNTPFAPGFDPGTLIGENTGFQAALDSLRDTTYVGAEELEDGSPVWHIRGVTAGPNVTSLAVGLIQSQEDVTVEVYIHRETRFPRRVLLIQPETITEEEPDPTTWTIDIYDVNAAPELTPPDEVDLNATPEPAAEVTAEPTAVGTASVPSESEPTSEPTVEGTAQP
jgi:hypothetical protein